MEGRRRGKGKRKRKTKGFLFISFQFMSFYFISFLSLCMHINVKCFSRERAHGAQFPFAP